MPSLGKDERETEHNTLFGGTLASLLSGNMRDAERGAVAVSWVVSCAVIGSGVKRVGEGRQSERERADWELCELLERRARGRCCDRANSEGDWGEDVFWDKRG